MGTGRLQSFSDGVIAIIITIMVLNLQVPASGSTAELLKELPVFLAYALSFLVVAIMWVNHHHMIHTVRHVHAALLWANNYLLFWMSLIPFVTAYLGRNHRSPLPVASYGFVLTMCSVAFTWLRYILARHHLQDDAMRNHHRQMLRKNLYSIALYALSVPLAYCSVKCSYTIFGLIPLLYFLPERLTGDIA
jgi:uncharacterized membrane protein